MLQFKELPPLSLYIHIPWCLKKCPYCDFNSHEIRNNFNETEYIKALIQDLEIALPNIWGRTINSIFIGGGTPSLFSAKAYDNLLSTIRSYTNYSALIETTMEINPATLESKYIKDYPHVGINRLSFGIQSFNDNHLATLGRIHDANMAKKAIHIAKNHFDNINLDIIYGLPSQTLEELERDIEIALDFDVNHLSFYNLTIEPNTFFYKYPPKNLPSNDLCYEMQSLIVDKLKKAFYNRYEISAFAKIGKECYHNKNYWLFGDYLGIGAGAHSKISFQDRVIRQVRAKQPNTYLKNVFKNSHIVIEEIVDEKNLAFEFLINAFRLTEGFNISLFTRRTTLPLNILLPKLIKAQEKSLIKISNNSIIPTKLGQDFLNDLLLLFLE